MKELKKNLIAITVAILSLQASADFSQSDLRSKFYKLAKRDFVAQVNASGLRRLVTPLNLIEKKFKQEIETHSDAKLTTLETKVLIRYPQFIPQVKRVREFAYGLSDRLCKEESGEGNEADAARHFIGSYALTLLTNESFARKYLTAHEGWLIDEDLDQFSAYNFASAVMDLKNNSVGVEAAIRDREQFKIFSIAILNKRYSMKQIRSMAVVALKRARRENKLVSVYNQEGACTQPTEQVAFHRMVGLPLEQSIW